MKKRREEQITNVISEISKRKIENIYFVACGGSMAALGLGEYFVDKELDIPSKLFTSNEFIHRNPKMIGDKSLVITRSHSGTTPETIEATKFAKEKGALTVAISMDEKSPLCEAADLIIDYDYKDEKDERIYSLDGDTGSYWYFLFKMMNLFSPKEKYVRILKQLEQLEKIILINKEKIFTKADQFAKRNKREEVIYTMSSGVYYNEVYAFTSCLLMEMLWIHSNPIHSGEYFHGPFEIADDNVPFLIVKGIGPSRPLDERAIDFTEKISENVEVVDVADLDYNGIDNDLKEYFGPAIIGSVLRQYAERLAEHTGHPLSVRRYMWKMKY